MDTTTTPQPFTLIDPYWQKHLTFNGRAPRTIDELAIARAESIYRARLAEIRALRVKIALLEEFARPLWDRGIKIGDREVERWTMDHKVLRIRQSSYLPDDKLYAALIELGFREIQRKAWGKSDVVTMKHGRALLVAIEVTAPALVTPPTGQSDSAPALCTDSTFGAAA